MIIGDFYRSLKAELLGLSVDKTELEETDTSRPAPDDAWPHDDDRYHSDESPPRSWS